jgi:hypothetical protein
MKKSKTVNPNQRPQNNDSFLEAFRDLGSDFISTGSNSLKQGAGDIKNTIFPFFDNPEENKNKNEGIGFDERPQERPQERKTDFRHEEKVLFTREQRETQVQVKNLQEELKKLAKATVNLASEAKAAEISAMQEVPAAGKYHVSFLEKFIKLLAELRSKLEESSIWLSAWNKKASKKNQYWGSFKKSGSKFLLSSDRYMSTQAG